MPAYYNTGSFSLSFQIDLFSLYTFISQVKSSLSPSIDIMDYAK